MSSANAFLAGLSPSRGEKRHCSKRLELVGEDSYDIPMTVISGAAEGPVLVAVAGVHAGEYVGTAALVELADALDPAEIAGDVILVPCLNASGFFAHARDIVPEDGCNLNAIFPGFDGGLTSERIAHWVASELFPGADFVLDLHSGAAYEELDFYAYVPQADAVRARILGLAAQTEIPALVPTYNTCGVSGYAAFELGIPALMVECGGMGECRAEAVARDRDVVLDAMAALGMRERREGRRTVDQRVFEGCTPVCAIESGLWRPSAAPGCELAAGDELGRMLDFTGRTVRSYTAERAGVLLHCTGSLAVRAHEPLATFAW